MDTDEEMWLVMEVLSFTDDLTINGHPLAKSEDPSDPQKFLPIFTSKKLAEDWSGNPDLVFQLQKVQ